jgi:hypothetical protein
MDYPILVTERLDSSAQYIGGVDDTTRVMVELDSMVHPVQYLNFAIQETSNEEEKDFFDYSSKAITTSPVVHAGYYFASSQRSTDTIESAQLYFNTHRRFREPMDALYLRQVVPLMHFPRIPQQFMYTINFALQPGSLQPTGTANFSRIDSKRLELYVRNNSEAASGFRVIVRAVAFNVLRVASGIAGVLYSH